MTWWDNTLETLKLRPAKSKEPYVPRYRDVYGELIEQAEWLRAWTPDKFLQALQWAIDPYNPDWRPLLELYRLVLLDGKVTAAWRQRLLNVLHQPFVVRRANGEEHVEATKMLQKDWYRQARAYILEAELWGYSCLQFRPLADGRDMEVVNLPRKHVDVVRQIVTIREHEDQGIAIEEMDNLLLARNEVYPLGLLSVVALLWLRKKDALSGLHRYGERNVDPILALMAETYSPQDAAKKEEFLKNRRRGGYMIFGTNDKLDAINVGTVSGYEAFLKPTQEIYNKEIEEVILLNHLNDVTQNTPAKEQAKARSVTVKDDLMHISEATNTRILPMLRPFFGDGLYIEFPRHEQLTQKEQLEAWEVAQKLGFAIPKERVEGLLGFPVEEKAPAHAGPPIPNPTDGE